MHPTEHKHQIADALGRFGQGPLRDNAIALFETLGYHSNLRLDLPDHTPAAFLADFDPANNLDHARALVDEWQTVDFLFQLTEREIKATTPQLALFEVNQVDRFQYQSYVFLAIDLRRANYPRGRLAQITREVNRLFLMPAMILFKHRDTLTLAIINRRPNQRDAERDVLDKVTLIKDVVWARPHRAHIEILFDLSLAQLQAGYALKTFNDLHDAWQKTLDSSELNKRFFSEVANWYFWAVQNVVFPPDANPDPETRNAISVIRLITRLIFVWFLREKGLVPDALFDPAALDGVLTYDDPQGSTYYKAVLQNLFFATLNTEMGGGRRFRGKNEHGMDGHHMVHTVYRYERYFKNPQDALSLFSTIPFLNGGLFECLDRQVDAPGASTTQRVDGFSDRADNPLRVPDRLFFDPDEHEVDLNEVYGTAGKRYKVRGLIDIFNRYKFTIDENTPIEQEVALDPELLGQVFENLLAAYNPETGTTARKQTGSFYTPREIVNYMVDESLIAYLTEEIRKQGAGGQDALVPDSLFPSLDENLRHLFCYTDEPHRFAPDEVNALIAAIDTLKILDPACGSGAFPMGILHKLVFVLGRLDPDNARWRALQRDKALHETEHAYQIGDQQARQRRLLEIDEAFERNSSDYGRKLYLIENCIYGVDIQPIAVQIAKLRFFISLVVEQTVDDGRPNRGILPLPNLETRFVAANTLIGLARPAQSSFGDMLIAQHQAELAGVRHAHFNARTPETKRKYRQRDAELRHELRGLLQANGWPADAAALLAHWDPYDQNASAPFFDPEWMFGISPSPQGEGDGGFSIVIGNPPYVRQEKIRDLKPQLQEQYTCYTGTADLYVYFYERGLRLLRSGGVLAYISSNKYFRSDYGEKLRQYLAGSAQIGLLIDFGDAPVFTAIAYPSIILARKGQPAAGAAIRALAWPPDAPLARFVEIAAAESLALPQAALHADGWRIQDQAACRLLDKLRRAGRPLGEYVNGRFYRGVLTGLNEAFVVDRPTRDRLIAEHPSSAQVLKPFLRGRDVKRWTVDFAEQYLIRIESSENKQHPWSGQPDAKAEQVFAQTYPAIYAHFRVYRDALKTRQDQGKYFWELRSCRYWPEFEQPKIMYPDIAQRAEFSFDDAGYYLVNTLYLMPTEQKWLVGLLNSQAVFWFYTKISTQIRGGFVRFIAQYVSQIPIPETGDPRPIEALVERILALKRANPAADVSVLEAEIDQHVYALYGLSAEEIEIVEH